MIVGLLCVGLGAIYLVPLQKAGPKPTTNDLGPSTQQFTPPADPIKTPASEIDQKRQDIQRKRIPFFMMLNEKYADQIDHASVIDEIDRLDLVIAKNDPDLIQWIIKEAIGPTARQYGFERVTFYVKNPVGTVEPVRVVAESSWDGAVRWNTFLK